MALSIISLNCKGFRHTSEYIKDTINEKQPTFLFLQETWHLRNTTSYLNNVSNDYLFKETSGVDCTAGILIGRPYGGLAIYFKRSMADKIERVPCDNRRICAIKYQPEGQVPLLLINVYMPCDTQSSTSLNPVYADTITDIETLMSDHVGDIILGGDWNTDTRRDNAQSMCFAGFTERCELRLGWNHISAKRQDTFFSEANGTTSCIDHFL